MTRRAFGLGPRHRVMFDIPQQPRPLCRPAVHAASVRLPASSRPTIISFSGPWELERLTSSGGILRSGQTQNAAHRLSTYKQDRNPF